MGRSRPHCRLRTKPDLLGRRGSKRVVALGRSILVIAWHLLSDPEARFYDLGPGYHAARIDPERHKCSHIRELEPLGSPRPGRGLGKKRVTRGKRARPGALGGRVPMTAS
jgi:hypothetical protein